MAWEIQHTLTTTFSILLFVLVLVLIVASALAVDKQGNPILPKFIIYIFILLLIASSIAGVAVNSLQLQKWSDNNTKENIGLIFSLLVQVSTLLGGFKLGLAMMAA